jgi:hypothetical protein
VRRPVPRNKWIWLGGTLVAVVFAMGVMSLFEKASSTVHQSKGKLTVVKEASQASFDYLVPGTDQAWKFDPNSPVFDQTKGVVNFKVILKDNNVSVTISQQKTPVVLKPVASSAKFNQFILASNVTSSEQVGSGKAYFRAALQNGAPASGATTVIYATDNVLIFGQAGSILSYDKWANLLASMHLPGK